MKGSLRAGIAKHILDNLADREQFGVMTPFFFALLREEAADVPVSRRNREKLLRLALLKTEESVRGEGYCPFRDRDSHDHRAVLWILDEALMPFLIAAIPPIASEVPIPWESPRATVSSIMKSLDNLKRDFFEVDWANTATRVFFDLNRPILSIPEWNRSFGTPLEFLGERLDSRLAEVREMIEVFFFDDPLKLEDRSGDQDSETPNRRTTGASKVPEFANRALWLVARLEERGWNKHQLAAHNGPDHKTTQKILDGLPVGPNVLDKVARALSTKRGVPHVAVTEIPSD